MSFGRRSSRASTTARTESGTRTLDTLFQVELELGGDIPARYYGQRVYVRFDHGHEPLALQWKRSLRQLFMEDFGV